MYRHRFAVGGIPIVAKAVVERLDAYCAQRHLHSPLWAVASHLPVLQHFLEHGTGTTPTPEAASQHRQVFVMPSQSALKGASQLAIREAFAAKGEGARGVPATLAELGYDVLPPWRHLTRELGEEGRSRIATRVSQRPGHCTVLKHAHLQHDGARHATAEGVSWAPGSHAELCEAALLHEARGWALNAPQDVLFAHDAALAALAVSHGDDAPSTTALLSRELRLFNVQETTNPFAIDTALQHYNAAHGNAPLPPSLGATLGAIMATAPFASTSWVFAHEARDLVPHGLAVRTGEQPQAVQTREMHELINLAAFEPAAQQLMTRKMPEHRRQSTQRQFRLFNRFHSCAALPRCKPPLLNVWISSHDASFYRKFRPVGVPGVPEDAWRVKIELPTPHLLFNMEQLDAVSPTSAASVE